MSRGHQLKPAERAESSANTALLSVLGLSADQERVYSTLIRLPNATVAKLAELTGHSTARTRASVLSLRTLGLVTSPASKPIRYAAVAPQAAIEVLALRRLEEIEHARAHAGQLQLEFLRSRHDQGILDLVQVADAAAAMDHFLQLLTTTRSEILGTGRSVADPALRSNAPDALSIRAIYDSNALEPAGAFERLQEWMARGEDVRILARLPLEFQVFDRAVAFLPLDDRRSGFLIIKAPAIVSAFSLLFESLWERSTPVRPPSDNGSALQRTDRHMLALLGAGLKRGAIARQLGISPATLDRRLKRLIEQLGAQSHVHLGILLAQRGLLPSDVAVET